MARCVRATEHGHARRWRVRESRPFSIRKSSRDHRTERPVSGAALAGNSSFAIHRFRQNYDLRNPFGANSRIAGLLMGNWKAREILPFCVAQTTLRTSTQPAHLLVKSPECGRADYHIRGLPLRSCRRKPHRREHSPVVWKVRKVQRKGFLSMWPRCPCIPAIDRRQFSEADNYANCETLYAHLRESGCRVRLCRVPDGTAGRRGRGDIGDSTPSEFANNATFWRCSACHG